MIFKINSIFPKIEFIIIFQVLVVDKYKVNKLVLKQGKS